MAGTSVIKAVPSHDVLNELRAFLAGATRSIKTNPLELARRALSLLKTLPATRDAVLEYFCTLFDGSVAKYMNDTLNTQKVDQGHSSTSMSNREDLTIAEIHDVLCNFVISNPEAWAPIISTWALELLGEISSRYAGRAQLSMSAGLNDTLQLWMSCCATRSLLDIITQCLSCLMHSNIEGCIKALLDTSVAHRPHFDWVVAHVGSCFPQTVITKVLSCGLKDFCQHISADEGVKAPKLNSVVGILGHLAGSHFADIRTALLELFKWSLQSGKDDETAQRNATVPFLIQLASLSPVLLQALTTDVLHTLTPEMLPKLAVLAPDWCNYFGSQEALEDLLIHLALGCEKGGTQILKLMLDAASPITKPEDKGVHLVVRSCSRDLLELLLREIDLQLRSTEPENCSIPLLESLRRDLSVVKPLLLSKDTLRVQTAVRLLALLGFHRQSVLISSASYLLQRATTDYHLAALIRLITGKIQTVSSLSSFSDSDMYDGNSCNFLTQALEQALWVSSEELKLESDSEIMPNPEQLWLNLAILLKWENSKKTLYLRGNLVSSAILANLHHASELLANPPTCHSTHAIAATLDLLDIPAHNKLHLVRAVVSYFFFCLNEEDSLLRLKGIEICCRLLSHLSVNSSSARVLAVREILEEALFNSQHAVLFGASEGSLLPEQNWEAEQHLLEENYKQGTRQVLTQRRSSLFHPGVVLNQVKTRFDTKISLSKEAVDSNTMLLIEVLKACCSSISARKLSTEQPPSQHPISLEAITSLSLLLVELISPDVMYNGLPWPEEEFCKVTVERDLHIWRVFEERPLVWSVAQLVASYRPALCYCSVLLRAITAMLLSQWGRSTKQPITTTVKLLELLALGQLLPPPLASLRDIVTRVQPHEVVQLLRDCVWNYLRDHVPSPALFTQDSTGLMWRDPTLAIPGPQYTDTLRFIIQNNIKDLGIFHSQLFVTTSKAEL